MTTTYEKLTIENTGRDKDAREFIHDVEKGLTNKPVKYLSSRFIYDDEGSRMFEQIMDLEEYYLTKSEFNILKAHKEQFSEFVDDKPFNLVELGAGNGEKTGELLQYFSEISLPFRYVPIDISEGAVKNLVEKLRARFPGMEVKGMVAEYFEALKWLKDHTRRKNIVLFLGSNIGNFHPDQRNNFLVKLKNGLNHKDLLVTGFDLRKDVGVINRAYNDSKGVTAAFNLNLLKRINRELGGEFNTDKFLFYARYNPFSGALESFLFSKEKQKVFIRELQRHFHFDQWEPIHTESSYKFTEQEIRKLADRWGFQTEGMFFDSRRYFVDAVWSLKS